VKRVAAGPTTSPLTYLYRRQDLGLPAPEPSWLDDPAVFRLTWTHPDDLPFLTTSKRSPHRLRPFCSLVVAVAATSSREEGLGRPVPVAGWHRGVDPRHASWFDQDSGGGVGLRPPPRSCPASTVARARTPASAG
jgi:hypothetical protein